MPMQAKKNAGRYYCVTLSSVKDQIGIYHVMSIGVEVVGEVEDGLKAIRSV